MKPYNHIIINFTAVCFLFSIPFFFFAEVHAETKWQLIQTINTNSTLECPAELIGGVGNEYYYPDPVYLGKKETNSLSEGSYVYTGKEVYDNVVYWDVTMNVSFAVPPPVLISGEIIPLKATISGTGFVLEGWENSVCQTFGYSHEGSGHFASRFETNTLCGDFQSDTIVPNYVVPIGEVGAQLSLYTYLMNSGCSIKWTYESKGELDEKERILIDMERAGWVPGDKPQSDEWCDIIERELKEKQEAEYWNCISPEVAVITALKGSVEIQLCRGDVYKAENNDVITIGNCITTGDNGQVQLKFCETLYQYPTILNIAANSTVCIADVKFDSEGNGKPFFEIISGWLRQIEKQSESRSIFSAKAGTVICGIRGTDFIIGYSPSDDLIKLYDFEGETFLFSLNSYENRDLSEGQKIVFDNGIFGSIETMTTEEWNELVKSQVLYSDLDGYIKKQRTGFFSIFQLLLFDSSE